MELTKETVPDVFHSWATVGTSAAKVSALTFPLLKGILVHSPGEDYPGGGNSDPIYIGNAGVTADETATGGIPLIPGASLFLPVQSCDRLYAVSTGADQLLAWLGQ